ncbi:hypothetical protein F5Y09DRAFT_315839 [Xylaria sp. FL1042]|nr:hypothetical protein F5Y09DRAFT_315839 [Xylaria sp. FL1042]
MFPLSHQDPTLAAAAASRMAFLGTKMPGTNGELRHSLDRRRTASFRLSCISEHQKENTRSSEDEYFLSSVQAIKTPTLQPVRWPRRRHQVNGKSQSSGDGSAVSPFQLDPEKIDGNWGQETIQTNHHRHVVLSTWRCATSVVSQEQTEQQHHHEVLAMKPRGLAAPSFVEVQWHIIRWTDAQPRNIYINGHRRTISGTGFDGPRSSTSGTSPLHSPSGPSSPPLGPLSLSNCIPCKSRRLKSDTSGSEKSYPERWSRKRRDVSESLDLDPLVHKQSVDASLVGEGKNSTGILKREEQDDQSKFRNAQEGALKSCPELYRRSFNVARSSISKFAPDTISGLKPPNYTQFDSNRHQHRHRIQETVSKRFYSLRDRLRRGRSSSMFSVRPEFPPPPAGKVRRYRSRNSNEIWPSSEESPIFNTPESNKSPVQPQGQNTALLAASGLRLAAVELDRLTNKSRSAKSSIEVARISSGTDSVRSESESSVADTTPAVPTNSPLSHLSPVPISRPPQKPGLRGRRQHSRLSEVTTPEEINCSTHIVSSWPVSPQVLYFASDPLPDILPGLEADGVMSLTPRPPSIQQPSSLHDILHGETSHASTSVGTQLPLDHDNSLEVVVGPGIILPERTCSRGHSLEQFPDETNWRDEGDTRENVLGPRHSILRLPLLSSGSEPDYHKILPVGTARKEIATKEPTLSTDVIERSNDAKSQSVLKEFAAKSCHPDTWSPSQGEPGDSEPFCPPECAYSKQCGHKAEG